jgi:transposase
VIHLTLSERRELLRIVRVGKHKAREITYAYILLRSADGWSESQIAEALDVNRRTVRRVRARYRDKGLKAALHECPRTGQPRKLTSHEEALLVSLACSPPPAGRKRWTVRLLTEAALKRKLVKQVVPETARRVLKKTR